MHAENAPRNADASVRKSQGSVRRPAFWCGLLLILFGFSAAGLMAGQEIGERKALIILLISAGLVEGFAGIIDHRAGGRTAAMDVLLGILSIAAGSLLLTPGWGSASSLVYLITIWLLVRGLVDLLGSALMRNAFIQDARMIRAAVDLALGLLSWVALMIVPWWELLFGWPESSVSVIGTLAGVSVVAAGAFLIVESRVQRFRQGTALDA